MCVSGEGGRLRHFIFSAYSLEFSIAGTPDCVFWHSYGWNGIGRFTELMLMLAIPVGGGYIIVFTSERREPSDSNETDSIAGLLFTPRHAVHHIPVRIDTPITSLPSCL